MGGIGGVVVEHHLTPNREVLGSIHSGGTDVSLSKTQY